MQNLLTKAGVGRILGRSLKWHRVFSLSDFVFCLIRLFLSCIFLFLLSFGLTDYFVKDLILSPLLIYYYTCF